jgi:PAS domain S-box-containing protein
MTEVAAAERRLLEALPCAFVRFDADWRIIQVNEMACALLERRRSELVGHLGEDVVPEAARSRFFEVYREAKAAGEPREAVDYFAPLERWFQVKAQPCGDDLMVFFSDVSQFAEERSAAQEKAAEVSALQELLAVILEGLREGVMAVDAGGRVMYANQASRRILGADMTGLDEEARLATHMPLHEDGVSPLATNEVPLARSLRGEQVENAVLWLRNPEGNRNVLLTVSAAPLRGSAGDIQGAVSWFHDITDEHLAEEERRTMSHRLAQSQKMEVVGQIAGGIAHDFNNLLTVILGNLDELGDQLAGQNDALPLAEMAQTAAGRAAELTHRLLAFSRGQALEPRISDINALVVGLESLMRRTLGEAIDIRVEASKGLWAAMVDPGELENAILNLAINARDAMPRGGRLTVSTANAQVSGTEADVRELDPGDYVTVAVSDNGTGISEDLIQRVFEPFFTTKDVGRGSGLGLSMVYGFARQSGGHVTVASTLGEGTTVTLYLPRARRAEAQPGSREKPSDRLPLGTERIAFVEDDALVRPAVEASLVSLGYRVRTFETAQALLVSMNDGYEFDMLVTDVVLPAGMNGQELAETVLADRPGTAVLFLSGYLENALVENGRLGEGIHLLSKPFRKEELAYKLREVLAAG